MKTRKIRAGLRYCSNCKSQFTVTIGTVFEDSKIPLRKWLIAWYMICSSKEGD
jgi:transposase-like protein